MKKSTLVAEILYADSETDANLYYATRFLVPDPVLFFRIRGKTHLILNDLEVDRGKKEAKVDCVHSQTEWIEKIKKKDEKKTISLSEMMIGFLKAYKIEELVLPHSFSAYFANELQKAGFRLSFRSEPFWQDRLLKTKEEKEAIKDSLKATSLAIQQAYKALRESKIQKGKIIFQGKALTSERLRGVIDSFLFLKGYLPQNTIVAGGDQAVDPHQRGTGLLAPNQSIVMDVFPRSLKTRYFADMTRTVVKGEPSQELKKIWHAVKEAQKWGIDQIKEGVDGLKIHEGILKRFEEKGFKTGQMNGRMQGFFHGTGHGLGLDIHEPPRVGKISQKLKEGMVVTVEPGLYYEGIGGVRIEDVVYVTKEGCEQLSSCPNLLSIS